MQVKWLLPIACIRAKNVTLNESLWWADSSILSWQITKAWHARLNGHMCPFNAHSRPTVSIHHWKTRQLHDTMNLSELKIHIWPCHDGSSCKGCAGQTIILNQFSFGCRIKQSSSAITSSLVPRPTGSQDSSSPPMGNGAWIGAGAHRIFWFCSTST